MSKKKLYLILFVACTAGWLWVALQLHYNSPAWQLCLFKKITTIPCPSCGSTRSVLELVKGNVYNALRWNPLGLISFVVMVVSPLWIVVDLITKSDTLLQMYLQIESLVRRRHVAIPLIILVLANWIWNIFKGL